MPRYRYEWGGPGYDHVTVNPLYMSYNECRNRLGIRYMVLCTLHLPPPHLLAELLVANRPLIYRRWRRRWWCRCYCRYRVRDCPLRVLCNACDSLPTFCYLSSEWLINSWPGWQLENARHARPCPRPRVASD